LISQQTFIIPPDIREGLAVGDLVQYGGVVRNQAGQIVKHLKGIDLPVTNEKATDAAVKVLKDTKVVAGTAVVAMAAAGVGALAFARMRRRTSLKCVASYNASLATYLDAVREGQLDTCIIGNLLAALDAVEAYSDEGGSIALDFSTDHAAQLVRLVIDSTKQLVKDNSLDVEGLKTPAAGDNVVHLRHYLEVQRRIFEEEAGASDRPGCA